MIIIDINLNEAIYQNYLRLADRGMVKKMIQMGKPVKSINGTSPLDILGLPLFSSLTGHSDS